MIRSLKIHDCLWSYLCRFSPSSHFLPRNIHNNSCSPCRMWFISSLYNLNSASFSNQTKQHFYDFVATQRSLDFFSWCSNEEISCLKWFWYSTSSQYSVWIQMRSCWMFQWQASAPQGISKATNAGCSEAHNVVSMWQMVTPWVIEPSEAPKAACTTLVPVTWWQ